MNQDKKHYFLKLNPPRPEFMQDMTVEEKEIMQRHVAYWSPMLENQTMVVFGPVFDPKGGFGVGIIAVETEEQLNALIAGDPANGLNHYEIYPMRAVYK